MFIFAGCLLCVLVLLLGLLWVAFKVWPAMEACFTAFRDKLFYGAFIRYLLLSTLKLQITFCGGLAIGWIIEPTVKAPEKALSFKVTAWSIVTLLWLAPVLISVVLYRNRDQLAALPVKKKIGALYDNFNPEKRWVTTYSIVFLTRRSFFVLVTYGLYHYPGLQVQLMTVSTMGYMCYIVQMSFYESIAQRRIETLNECLLLLICCQLAIFSSLSLDDLTYEDLGDSVVVVVLLLLGFNSLIIVVVNIKVVTEYCRRRKLIKKRDAEIARL